MRKHKGINSITKHCLNFVKFTVKEQGWRKLVKVTGWDDLCIFFGMHTVLKPLYARVSPVKRGRAVLATQGKSCLFLHGRVFFFIGTKLLHGLKCLLTVMLVCGSGKECWPGPLVGGASTINCSLWGGDETVAAGLSVVCILTFSEAASLKRKKSLWSVTDLICKEIASASVEGKKKIVVK